MKKLISRHWPFLIILSAFSIFYLWGVGSVPFHPDESTQIYMSQDFTHLFTNPSALTWKPDKNPTPEQLLRELDAPITKYLIGLGRTLTGKPPLSSNWDWGASWKENQEAGALPSHSLLTTARMSISLLFPFSLLFLYLTAARLKSRYLGIIASVLLGTNAIALLHTRRAMAEGTLLFGTTFFLWSLLDSDKRPWLTGLAMAIAFNAKQSTLALFPIGLLAVAWTPQDSKLHFKKMFANIGQYLGIFILVTMLLNPFLWKHPIQAAQASWDARHDLLQRQSADVARLAPEKLLSSSSKRILALVANVYIAPPSFKEVGNYQNYTRTSEEAYLSFPGHTLYRGLLAGGFFLSLTVVGIFLAILHSVNGFEEQRRHLILFLGGTLTQTAGLLFVIPFPWQRYVIPVIPFICLWIAYNLSPLFPGRTHPNYLHLLL